MQKTGCFFEDEKSPELLRINKDAITNNLYEIHLALHQHWFDTIKTSDIDAKHDTVFGFVFYALALFSELFAGQNRQGLTGRLILRTLVECRISLRYLVIKDDVEIWKKFRSFGSGQAKLALLKFNDFAEKSSFINEDILEQLSNEDVYQEYVNIDLGHWCGLDLRKMSEISGTKDDYDKYYGWSSNYVHGQWPALRYSCLTTCFNPLHRLHRTPLLKHRLAEDILPDAVYLINKLLSELSDAYPSFSVYVKL